MKTHSGAPRARGEAHGVRCAGDIFLIFSPCCNRELHDLWDYGLPLWSGSLLECPYCGNLLKVETRQDHQLILVPHDP